MPAKRRDLMRRLKGSWATRSLAIGAIATVIDVAIGTTLLTVGLSTRGAAMTGTVVGAIVAFFANRAYAFKESTTPSTGRSALRYFALAVSSSAVHGQVVVWLRDHLGVPFVPSKVLADLVISSVGQLLLLRYVVFPKKDARLGQRLGPST